MTHVLETLQAEKERLQKSIDLSLQNRVGDLKDFWAGQLADALHLSDSFRINNTSIEILRDHPDYSYQKDILTLYYREDYWETRTIKSLEIKYYTTTSQSEFELRRLVTIGKISQILLDKKEELLSRVNEIYKAHDLTPFQEKIWELNKSIKEEEQRLENEKINQILNQKEVEGTGKIKLKWDFEPGIEGWKRIPKEDTPTKIAIQPKYKGEEGYSEEIFKVKEDTIRNFIKKNCL